MPVDLMPAESSQLAVVSRPISASDPARQTTMIDLLPKSTSNPRCERSSADEIVICAPDPEQFRLRPLPNVYEKSTPDAKLELGQGTTVAASAEAASVGGWTSNRIMVRFKLKF